MTIREAVKRGEQFLAWRRRIYYAGDQDRMDADALDMLLHVARWVMSTEREEQFEQDHGIGSEGEWNPSGGGQAA